MFGKKGSKILKLPSVRNCFSLAMTNKLVVTINSFKVPKIKKILLYKMKVLVRNYSCLQKPWLGGYRPQIPVLSVLYTQLNFLNPPPPPRKNSWLRHCIQSCNMGRSVMGNQASDTQNVLYIQQECLLSCFNRTIKLCKYQIVSGPHKALWAARWQDCSTQAFEMPSLCACHTHVTAYWIPDRS